MNHLPPVPATGVDVRFTDQGRPVNWTANEAVHALESLGLPAVYLCFGTGGAGLAAPEQALEILLALRERGWPGPLSVLDRRGQNSPAPAGPAPPNLRRALEAYATVRRAPGVRRPRELGALETLLAGSGMTTLDQLAAAGPDWVLLQPRCGPRVLAEAEALLAHHGWRFAPTPPLTPVDDARQLRCGDAIDEYRRALGLVWGRGTDPRNRLGRLLALTPTRTLGELRDAGPDWVRRQPGSGEKTVAEARALLAHFGLSY